MDLLKRKLYKVPNHPISILTNKVKSYFESEKISDLQIPDEKFILKDSFDPLVNTKQAFDDVLIPKDHISRQPSETYYYDENTVLRPHTSVHQVQMIRDNYNSFLVSGDVYRRDTIDRTHYPAFHQMEGVRIFTFDQINAKNYDDARLIAVNDLKQTLLGLSKHVFGDVESRWAPENFPFTDPSLELEILYQEDWMEILGCGVIHDDVMKNAGRDPQTEVGWAFGLGLDRWAMNLFKIHDIRLFWSQDSRFLDQFKEGEITEFKEYSRYPSCCKDVTFWINEEYDENSFMELIRDNSGDMVEAVECIDTFTHPKTNRMSKCYKLTYRHMDRNLTNEEVDKWQFQLRDRVESELGVELR
jgi:phenylalanyl-tRNA synthetase alpha chain